jgi:cytochrome c553
MPRVFRSSLFRFAVAAAALAPLGAQAGDDDMIERLAACAACHGARGEGAPGAEYYPHLAGKPAGYLLEQLQGFRDGRRLSPQMTWLVQFMDDAWMTEIAAFYAAQPPRTRAADTGSAALTDTLRQRAETLVRDGDKAAGVPACAACHGADLAGVEPGVPALVGLPAEYVIAQLGGWREGVRRGVAPDCMADVANRLTPEHIRAVAVWLSQQSHDDGRRPAPPGSVVPPIACGGLPHAQVSP